MVPQQSVSRPAYAHKPGQTAATMEANSAQNNTATALELQHSRGKDLQEFKPSLFYIQSSRTQFQKDKKKYARWLSR